MTIYELQGTDGVTSFRGTIKPPPGGGSQPGVLAIADFIFNEPAGAHADLTATFAIPAGATILDIWLYPIVAPWTDTNPIFSAGDTANGATYYFSGSPNLNSFLTTNYGAANIGDGSNFGSVNAYGNVPTASPPWLGDNNSGGGGQTFTGGGVPYVSADTLTMKVGGIANGHGVNPAGQLLVRIVYLGAITAVVAA